jgi:pyruvate/2-oxoglutarate dehydrogenase complex dihydrolipoamide acyltransferase (E2) component
MAFDHIEKIKREYTDKYVTVDGDRPELARFKGEVGQVKTVNMSGRALVEFVDYHLNIGRYDIDLDYLKVVDKPDPKEKKTAAKKPAAKPAAKKAPSSAPAGEKLSPLEMARMQGAAETKAAKPAEPAKKKASSGKVSTADILAMARGGQASAPATSEEPANQDPPEPALDEEPVAEAPAEETASASSGEKVDKSKMSISDIIAWCREHDAS